jgi:hypothetical protein
MTISIITLCEYAEYRRAGADIFSYRNDKVKSLIEQVILYKTHFEEK